MDRARFYLSLIVAKIIFCIIKILNKSQGSSFVGLVVLKICPNFLRYAIDYVKGVKISVTGTNGKTTTCGILSHIFEYGGKKIIHNEKGANMLSGVANVFAEEITPFKKFDGCVIESDEAYLTRLYDYADFDCLIVTNLFRDQLDRYGELDTTALKISNAIDKNQNLKLFLNADNPIVADFGTNRKAIYFGFENIRLTSDSTETSHNTKRPECKYSATLTEFEEHSVLKINEMEFTLSLKGRYNAYNALAAISLALECGKSQSEIQNALNTYEPAFGRFQKCKIEGRETVIQLIKNPTGTSEVLKTVDLKSNILIAINDKYADGRDVSWLWDSDFEHLKDVENEIVVSGIRALDMGLRLKYAGIKEDKIIVLENIKKALNYLIQKTTPQSKITILPSYTALLEIKKKQSLESFQHKLL